MVAWLEASITDDADKTRNFHPIFFLKLPYLLHLAGLPKKTQTYLFFQIHANNVDAFRTHLAQLVPHITTIAQVKADLDQIAKNKQSGDNQLLKLSGINIAFSQKGLTLLGITDAIGDDVFKAGMLADAKNLGDKNKNSSGTFAPDWDPAFLEDIHGLILVSGDSHTTVSKQINHIEHLFRMNGKNASIHKVISIVGDVRPGEEKGHEHFGFLDGISQPTLDGLTEFEPFPNGEKVPTIAQGVTLVGRPGDKVTNRPSWALDGSFLSFRYLFQLVPEFNSFLQANPIPGMPAAEGSELLGARLVGRWKSGAPVDLAPLKDNPTLGADTQERNDFRYTADNNDQQTQDRCPFAAHTRKTNPRADLEDHGIPTDPQRIIRRGIQFGPEVSAGEAASGKTAQGRGLLFACYQSNIANGFQFIQTKWANNVNFPPFKTAVAAPGFDPIIGQENNDNSLRTMEGTNPASQGTALSLSAEWVVPKGGEYFFSPSISALKGTFATGATTGTKVEL
ncbi:MAG: dye-decolorizing heme-containing peroxidase [Ramalina farinacea]|uniref:Dye-decolorizing heme-containing peroxidase n=1 Tax=Ramalina farinacea TaxID=258253 RepID=A0AA43QJE7_9LECA|nr:dye-decolorizing heme-containing peroxidase [Ramalina farinacea]